jgi:hypothetical protein
MMFLLSGRSAWIAKLGGALDGCLGGRLPRIALQKCRDADGHQELSGIHDVNQFSFAVKDIMPFEGLSCLA